MISYLVDGALLAALLVGAWRVGRVHRELNRLRGAQGQYQRALDESVAALERAAQAFRDVEADAGRTLAAVDGRIADANAIIVRLEGLSGAAATRARSVESRERLGESFPGQPRAAPVWPATANLSQ